MRVPNKLHFIHLDFALPPDEAATIAEWAIRSPVHSVYIWTSQRFMAVAMETVMDSLTRIARPHGRATFTTMNGTDPDGNFLDERIEAKLPAPFGSFVIHIRRLENYREYFPERLVWDEVYKWRNKQAARRLLKFAILYIEGGYVIEQYVKLETGTFPLQAEAPRDILFYMHPGEPPVFSDDVVASGQHTPKALELLGMLARKYDCGEYMDIGGEFSMAPEGISRLQQFAERRMRIRDFAEPENTEEEIMQFMQKDTQFLAQMERTKGRSGVAVVNSWIKDREELSFKEDDFLVDQYVLIEKESAPPVAIDPSINSGLTFVDDHFADPDVEYNFPELGEVPRYKEVQEGLLAEYHLYSIEKVLGCTLSMRDTVKVEKFDATENSRRTRGRRKFYKTDFELM